MKVLGSHGVCVTFFQASHFRRKSIQELGMTDSAPKKHPPSLKLTASKFLPPKIYGLGVVLGAFRFGIYFGLFFKGVNLRLLVSGSVGARWAKKHQWINGVISTCK